jgi:uncharacterized membrane protein
MTTETRGADRSMRDFEGVIGRLLIGMTYVAVACLVVGVGLLVASGVGVLDGGPAFDPGTLVADLLALEPAAFLWLGLGVVLATPIVRVATSGIAYARRGQWTMVLIAIGILVVIAIGVAGSLITET